MNTYIILFHNSRVYKKCEKNQVGTVVGTVVGTDKVREKSGGHCGVHMWTLNKYGKNHAGTVVYTVGTEQMREKDR